eukprot:TRINITY_DN7277_c0_g1_i12.p1 TRINITY_DN7277_c0_g1~~TRINITY_DN7277_c0_g1_i12.p1  ORF type:complete len:325 (+),score=22.92 TRINITY_DN7277_c0_g1_i12:31-975(+)
MQNQNPLELPNVIQRVCRFLDAEHILQNVRPVCQTWLKVAEDRVYWDSITKLCIQNEGLNDDQLNVKNITKVLKIFHTELITRNITFRIYEPWFHTLGKPFSCEVMQWEGSGRYWSPYTDLLSSDWSELALSRLWQDTLNEIGGTSGFCVGLDSRGEEWTEIVYKLQLKNYREKWMQANLDMGLVALVAVFGVMYRKYEGVARGFMVQSNSPLPLKRRLPNTFPSSHSFYSLAETIDIKGKDAVTKTFVLGIKLVPDSDTVYVGLRAKSGLSGQPGPTLLFSGVRLLPVKLLKLLLAQQNKGIGDFIVDLDWMF